MWYCYYTGRWMLNPLEKLLDVYCNYNYDFTSTRKTFWTYKCTKIWGGLINPGFVSSFLWAQLLVPGTGGQRVPSKGPAGCDPLQGYMVQPASEGRRDRLGGSRASHITDQAGLWARPCEGSWPQLCCHAWAGLATVQGLSHSWSQPWLANEAEQLPTSEVCLCIYFLCTWDTLYFQRLLWLGFHLKFKWLFAV